jgi:hypothetical protein
LRKFLVVAQNCKTGTGTANSASVEAVIGGLLVGAGCAASASFAAIALMESAYSSCPSSAWCRIVAEAGVDEDGAVAEVLRLGIFLAMI